jgi:hypothetical protein
VLGNDDCVIGNGKSYKEAVDAVEQATEAWEKITGVLHPEIALDKGFD